MAENEQQSDQFDELFMSETLFKRLRQLKEEHAEDVQDIDRSISDIQDKFSLLRDRLNTFNDEQEKLLTVFIARSIKQALREILIQDTDLPEIPD